MIVEKCLDELSKKSLICEINTCGLVHTTVVKMIDNITVDVILNNVINLTSDTLLSYEYWDSDDFQNEIKMNNYVIDKQLRIDFFKKLMPGLPSEFSHRFILSSDKLRFIKEFFGGDIYRIKEFKVGIINNFCDNIILELSDSMDSDVKLITQCLMDIKSDGLDRLKTVEDIILYWPDLLYPNPLDT